MKQEVELLVHLTEAGICFLLFSFRIHRHTNRTADSLLLRLIVHDNVPFFFRTFVVFGGRSEDTRAEKRVKGRASF